jgi:hypothetical protein
VDDEKARSTEHEQSVPESLTAHNIIFRSRTIYRQMRAGANNLLGPHPALSLRFELLTENFRLTRFFCQLCGGKGWPSSFACDASATTMP